MKRMKIKIVCGVYCLVGKRERLPLYVGCSKNVYHRVAQHIENCRDFYSKKKTTQDSLYSMLSRYTIDPYLLCECDEDELHCAETYFIDELQPLLNKGSPVRRYIGKTGRIYWSMSDACRGEYGKNSVAKYQSLLDDGIIKELPWNPCREINYSALNLSHKRPSRND